MDSILQQLYNGGRDALWSTANGREQLFRCWKKFGQILQEQAPELEPKFTVLMDDLTTFYFEDLEEMFYRGFGLAVKLFSEGLAL